jgi:hypothetical protein
MRYGKVGANKRNPGQLSEGHQKRRYRPWHWQRQPNLITAVISETAVLKSARQPEKNCRTTPIESFVLAPSQSREAIGAPVFAADAVMHDEFGTARSRAPHLNEVSATAA